MVESLSRIWSGGPAARQHPIGGREARPGWQALGDSVRNIVSVAVVIIFKYYMFANTLRIAAIFHCAKRSFNHQQIKGNLGIDRYHRLLSERYGGAKETEGAREIEREIGRAGWLK